MSSFAPAALFVATGLAVLIGAAALTRAGRARDRPGPLWRRHCLDGDATELIKRRGEGREQNSLGDNSLNHNVTLCYFSFGWRPSPRA